MTDQQIPAISSLRLCMGSRQPMNTVESVSFKAGHGIEGDRHAATDGVRATRQVLLMDQETIDAMSLQPGDVRENVTTTGLSLAELSVGQRLSLGADAVVEISGPCAPCQRMDELRPGLPAALQGRRGILAFVVQDGEVRVGDSITALSSAAVGG